MVVGHQNAGTDGRHPAVKRVKSEGLAQKISDRFAGTADAAETNHLVGPDVELKGDLHDLIGDGIVSATLAER